MAAGPVEPPAWLKAVVAVDDRTLVGVMVKRMEPDQLHAGIIYRVEGEAPRLLHLGWHRLLLHEAVDVVKDETGRVGGAESAWYRYNACEPESNLLPVYRNWTGNSIECPGH